MPNAILRAGPYASSTDSFISTPPSTQSFNDLVLPVNCNRRDWVNDDWKALLISSNDGSNLIEEVFSRDTNGTITLNIGTIDRPADFEGIYFRYQAAQSFTLSGTFSIDTTDHTFGIGSFSNKTQFFSSTSASSTFSVTLPAAIIPQFIGLTFEGDTELVGEGTIVINNILPRT